MHTPCKALTSAGACPGLAFHHAALEPQDRSIVEDLFRDRKIGVRPAWAGPLRSTLSAWWTSSGQAACCLAAMMLLPAASVPCCSVAGQL